MASSASENASLDQENFQKFFTKWKDEQNHLLQDLVNASTNTPQQQQQQKPTTDSSQRSSLVDRVMAHYEEYYRAKSKRAKGDTLQVMTPPWKTPLENAHLWVGGWRPSTAIHLLYSKSGLQLEAQLSSILSGLKTGDLGDLSSSQLRRVDKLHRSTIQEERQISEKAAMQQDTVADKDMVEMSHDASDPTQAGRSNHSRVNSILDPKEEELRTILQSADDLRLRTLRGVIDILSSSQAVHFLIAAAELNLKVHEWGKEKERKQGVSASQTS